MSCQMLFDDVDDGPLPLGQASGLELFDGGQHQFPDIGEKTVFQFLPVAVAMLEQDLQGDIGLFEFFRLFPQLFLLFPQFLLKEQ